MACFSTALGMTVHWLYQFVKDEDLCQVDFKPFESFSVGEYPMLSICFEIPYRREASLEDKTYNKSENVEADELAFNLADFYLSDEVTFRNGTIMEGLYPDFLNELPMVTYAGFYSKDSDRFNKCFGLKFHNKNVEKAAFRYNSSVFRSVINENAFLSIRPHLPNKMLMAGKNEGRN